MSEPRNQVMNQKSHYTNSEIDFFHDKLVYVSFLFPEMHFNEEDNKVEKGQPYTFSYAKQKKILYDPVKSLGAYKNQTRQTKKFDHEKNNAVAIMLGKIMTV